MSLRIAIFSLLLRTCPLLNSVFPLSPCFPCFRWEKSEVVSGRLLRKSQEVHNRKHAFLPKVHDEPDHGNQPLTGLILGAYP